MWRRNTSDPLMRLFLDKYYLHLLSIPREDVLIGDLYAYDGSRVSTPGKITYFLEPPMELPTSNVGEIMADITETVSNNVSINFGLGILEKFLIVLRAGSLLEKLRFSYKSKKAKLLKIRFSNATRDSIDVFQLGVKLIKHKLLKNHPLYHENYHYYVVTAVVRTNSISIFAESEKSKAIDINVETLKIFDIHTKVLVEKSNEGELTFIGNKNLAIGVELYEIKYDSKRNMLKLKLPKGVIKVKKPEDEEFIKPVFIGGSEDDIFLEVDYLKGGEL